MGVNFEAITDPLVEMDLFRARAEKEGVLLPEAMTLATVGLDGRPKARVVLLKGREGRELQFFTNYESAKARELKVQPWAALCMHFAALQLQVRVEGEVHRIGAELSDEYFKTRPRDSQLGAWASKQSRALASRDELDRSFEAERLRFAGQDVPRPANWGGFSLKAQSVELWVGQGGRLHDRAVYRYEGAKWLCQRLYP